MEHTHRCTKTHMTRTKGLRALLFLNGTEENGDMFYWQSFSLNIQAESLLFIYRRRSFECVSVWRQVWLGTTYFSADLHLMVSTIKKPLPGFQVADSQRTIFHRLPIYRTHGLVMWCLCAAADQTGSPSLKACGISYFTGLSPWSSNVLLAWPT